MSAVASVIAPGWAKYLSLLLSLSFLSSLSPHISWWVWLRWFHWQFLFAEHTNGSVAPLPGPLFWLSLLSPLLSLLERSLCLRGGHISWVVLFLLRLARVVSMRIQPLWCDVRFELVPLSEGTPVFLNPDNATKLQWARLLGKAIQFPTISR